VVIRKSHPLRWWISIAVILVFVAIAIPIGTAVWYTRSTVQHECAALKDLTAKPITKPANPAANPSRVATYNFYIALLDWEKADGC
jgi:hypothetical protein